VKNFLFANLFVLTVIAISCGFLLVFCSLAQLVHPRLMLPAGILSLIATGYTVAALHRYVEQRWNRAHRSI